MPSMARYYGVKHCLIPLGIPITKALPEILPKGTFSAHPFILI